MAIWDEPPRSAADDSSHARAALDLFDRLRLLPGVPGGPSHAEALLEREEAALVIRWLCNEFAVQETVVALASTMRGDADPGWEFIVRYAAGDRDARERVDAYLAGFAEDDVLHSGAPAHDGQDTSSPDTRTR